MSQLTFQIRGYCEAQVKRASEVTQLAAREPEFTRDQSSQNQWCQPLVASVVIAFIILSVCVPRTVHNIPDSYNSPSGWLASQYFAGEKNTKRCVNMSKPKVNNRTGDLRRVLFTQPEFFPLCPTMQRVSEESSCYHGNKNKSLSHAHM